MKYNFYKTLILPSPKGICQWNKSISLEITRKKKQLFFDERWEILVRQDQKWKIKINTATTTIIYAVNQVIKLIITNENFIIILPLDLKFYLDTSFNNLLEGSSLNSYIVCICDKEKTLVPKASSSTQLKRVAQSMLAAETLALTDACDAAFYISSGINDIFMI